MTKKRKGERPDGRIQVSATVGKTSEGKPIRKYFYGKTRKEAQERRTEYLKKLETEREEEQEQGITLAEWVDLYLETYPSKVKPEYESHRRRYFLHLKNSQIGSKPIVKVTELDIQNFLNQYEGYSKSFCVRLKCSVASVFEKALKNHIIKENPTVDVQIPKSTSGTHRALTDEEVAIIIEHRNDTDLPFKRGVLLMLYSGLRIGEACALNWKNVDLANRTIKVCQTTVHNDTGNEIVDRTKTSAGTRIVPICDPLLEILESIPEAERVGTVIVNKKGMPYTTSSEQSAIAGYCNAMTRKLNGEKPYAKKKSSSEYKVIFSFRAHDLRHTFTTFLYRANVPAKAASEILGHSNVQITMNIYTHLSDKDRADTSDKINRYLRDHQF